MHRILVIVTLIFNLSIVSAQETPPDTTGSAEVQQPVEQTSQPQPAQSSNLFGDALSELINLRNDLELLATAVKGTVRPEGWSGNLDVTNPELPLLIRLDLELLLADTLGFNVPDDWFGIAFSETQYQVRDMRHDIEILANALLGEGSRPDGWAGNPNPLWTCSRATQTLVQMLGQGDFFNAVADPNSPDYCAILELQTVTFVQQSLFTIDTDETYFTAGVRNAQPGSVTVDTNFAVGFYDILATQRAGVIPTGTTVTPLGRSTTNQFSRMVLFEGDGFLLFAEYPATSLTEEAFEILPAAPAVQTYCDADWC